MEIDIVVRNTSEEFLAWCAGKNLNFKQTRTGTIIRPERLEQAVNDPHPTRWIIPQVPPRFLHQPMEFRLCFQLYSWSQIGTEAFDNNIVHVAPWKERIYPVYVGEFAVRDAVIILQVNPEKETLEIVRYEVHKDKESVWYLANTVRNGPIADLPASHPFKSYVERIMTWWQNSHKKIA